MELLNLKRIAPEIFSAEVNEQIESSCARWVLEMLDYSDEVKNLDELDEVRFVAQQLNAWSSDFDEPYDQAERRIAEQEGDAEAPDDDEAKIQRAFGSSWGDPESIDALFSRLTDQD